LGGLRATDAFGRACVKAGDAGAEGAADIRGAVVMGPAAICVATSDPTIRLFPSANEPRLKTSGATIKKNADVRLTCIMTFRKTEKAHPLSPFL